MTITLNDIRRALAVSASDGFDPREAQARMSPNPRPIAPPPGIVAKQAAVLLLLFKRDDGGLYFPLMRRQEYPGDVHSGQISLPGGRQEQDETYEQTALREAEEEIGITPGDVQIIGTLTPLYVPPSNFEIHPIVGTIGYFPRWIPHIEEVAEMIEAPVDALFDDSLKGQEMLERRGAIFEIRYYRINGHKVWGATAIMLGELETRLRLAVETNQ